MIIVTQLLLYVMIQITPDLLSGNGNRGTIFLNAGSVDIASGAKAFNYT